MQLADKTTQNQTFGRVSPDVQPQPPPNHGKDLCETTVNNDNGCRCEDESVQHNEQSTSVGTTMMATHLQSELSGAQPSARSIGEDVADLLICVEEINRRLSDTSRSDKWHWRSRCNVAVFLLNRLADEARTAGVKVTVPAIEPKQGQPVLSHHPLVGPTSEYPPNSSAESSSELGEHVRKRVNHLYSS